jgi:hypothetical protein
VQQAGVVAEQRVGVELCRRGAGAQAGRTREGGRGMGGVQRRPQRARRSGGAAQQQRGQRHESDGAHRGAAPG